MGGVRSGVNGMPAFYINGGRPDASYEFAPIVACERILLLLADRNVD
jgi:hypothetical protein